MTVQNDDVLEYSEAVKKGQVDNLIIGISSPLLAKYFEKFPAILHLDEPFFKDKKSKNPK